MTIEKIRVSIGSAVALGLSQNRNFDVLPTTCYVMTYLPGRCTANCGFCPQSRTSKGSIEFLSRVTWPIYDFEDFLTKLNYMLPSKRFERICIQTLNYKQNFNDIVEIVSRIKKNSSTPISIAIPPMPKEKLKKLKLLGVERVAIALDGATEEIFEKVKGKGVNGPYSWNSHLQNLRDALEVFSEKFVTTHLIVGLGETPIEILELIQKLHKLKIRVSLFAFTPIKGTLLYKNPKPELINYRKVQLGRYLLVNQNRTLNHFTFNSKGDVIKFNLNKKELYKIIENSNAFMTTGCPGCNRPYYTSRPSGPMYNYPRKLEIKEKQAIYESLLKYVN